VEKHGRTRQAIYVNITRSMCFACRVTKAITDTLMCWELGLPPYCVLFMCHVYFALLLMAQKGKKEY
jgi:hypothetical protein